MLKKELAALLGISASAVSQLARKGMPTHSHQAAVKWRKRHLEPGRVKGQRIDTITAKRPDPLDVVRRLIVLATEDFGRHGPSLDAAMTALPDELADQVDLPDALAQKLFASDIARDHGRLITAAAAIDEGEPAGTDSTSGLEDRSIEQGEQS